MKIPRARHTASRGVTADVAYGETLGRRNLQSFIRLSNFLSAGENTMIVVINTNRRTGPIVAKIIPHSLALGDT